MNDCASYNPDTLELIPGVTAYSAFHEWAHLEQHALRTRLWEWRQRARLSAFRHVANLAVECEAAFIALRDLRRCGILQASDFFEAAEGLLQYLLSCTIFYP